MGDCFCPFLAWCAEGLKEGHNRLMSEAKESGMLGIKAAAHVVHASSQPFYQGIFRKPKVNFQLVKHQDACFRDMHSDAVIVCVHGVLVNLQVHHVSHIVCNIQLNTSKYTQYTCKYIKDTYIYKTDTNTYNVNTCKYIQDTYTYRYLHIAGHQNT